MVPESVRRLDGRESFLAEAAEEEVVVRGVVGVPLAAEASDLFVDEPRWVMRRRRVRVAIAHDGAIEVAEVAGATRPRRTWRRRRKRSRPRG